MSLIMRMFCVGILTLILSVQSTTRGQDSLVVSLSIDHIKGDTISVFVNVGALSDTISVPIWAFQFEQEVSPEIQYLGIDDATAKTDHPGWTTGTNESTGRVGGFSSFLDAVKTGGPLIKLRFLRSSNPAEASVCLNTIRLNTGIPGVYPETPCITFE